MKTIELTTSNVIDILNWYALEGERNWGMWGNYPTLPIGAAYCSFDTCNMKIMLKGEVTFKGETFNCISDGRRVPGRNIKRILIHTLRDLCKQDGVIFANEFMTADKAAEISNKRVEDARKTVELFEKMSTYQWQEQKVREQLTNAINDVHVSKEWGKSIPETITGYAFTIKNYCEKEEVTLIVDLTLTGHNSKKTVGYYKCSPIDIEEVVALFTNERVSSESANLEIHRQTLAKLTNK